MHNKQNLKIYYDIVLKHRKYFIYIRINKRIFKLIIYNFINCSEKRNVKFPKISNKLIL